jgi:hypothetical protein
MLFAPSQAARKRVFIFSRPPGVEINNLGDYSAIAYLEGFEPATMAQPHGRI